MNNAVLVLTTAGSRLSAQTLADLLVSEHLAACVSIQGPIQSTYHWQGAIEHGEEHQLLIKTVAANLSQIETRLKEIHAQLADGYQLPELMVVPISGGSSGYLAWLVENSQPR